MDEALNDNGPKDRKSNRTKEIRIVMVMIIIVGLLLSMGVIIPSNQYVSVIELYESPQFQPGNFNFKMGDVFYVRDKVVTVNLFRLPKVVVPDKNNQEATIDTNFIYEYTAVKFESTDQFLYFEENQTLKFPIGDIVNFKIRVKDYGIENQTITGEENTKYLPETLYISYLMISYQSAIAAEQFTPINYSVDLSGQHPIINITEVTPFFPNPINWSEVSIIFHTDSPLPDSPMPSITLFGNDSIIGELSDEPNSHLNITLSSGQRLVIDMNSSQRFTVQLVLHEKFNFQSFIFATFRSDDV